MYLDTQANLGSWPHGSLNHFFGVFVPDFLWPVTLLCLVLSLYLVYLRVLPHVHVHICQPRWGLAKRPTGRLSIASFLTSSLEITWPRRVSWLWELSGNGPTSFLVLLCMFWSFCPQGVLSLGGPIYLPSGAVSIVYQELTKKTHYFLSIQWVRPKSTFSGWRQWVPHLEWSLESHSWSEMTHMDSHCLRTFISLRYTYIFWKLGKSWGCSMNRWVNLACGEDGSEAGRRRNSVVGGWQLHWFKKSDAGFLCNSV